MRRAAPVRATYMDEVQADSRNAGRRGLPEAASNNSKRSTWGARLASLRGAPPGAGPPSVSTRARRCGRRLTVRRRVSRKRFQRCSPVVLLTWLMAGAAGQALNRWSNNTKLVQALASRPPISAVASTSSKRLASSYTERRPAAKGGFAESGGGALQEAGQAAPVRACHTSKPSQGGPLRRGQRLMPLLTPRSTSGFAATWSSARGRFAAP
mmetsp:Transcript_43019/g.138281  ORF Transcript_43019/g.138281 Transcript_43019/m.138281 type:complete len:211 (+) Transcript_43019:959-1591(+)